MSWWGNDLFPDLVYVDMFVHYAFNYWESLLQYQLCDGDCLDYGIWMVRRFHAPEQHICPLLYQQLILRGKQIEKQSS